MKKKQQQQPLSREKLQQLLEDQISINGKLRAERDAAVESATNLKSLLEDIVYGDKAGAHDRARRGLDRLEGVSREYVPSKGANHGTDSVVRNANGAGDRQGAAATGAVVR